jgi:predicted nucleic acid-binding Zn ribbon protein
MYKIFHYECKKCQCIQEYWVKNGQKMDQECKECGAHVSELVKRPSWTGTRHGTWGRWHV